MKYVELVQWSTQGDSIEVEMFDEDQNDHRFTLSAQCAGALAAVLAAEVEKIGTGDKGQIIRPTGMQTAKTEDGEPVVLMSFRGGVELPLVFKPESLAVLITQLQGLLRAVQPGNEVRWN